MIKDFLILPATFWRRRLQAQKLYIDLIRKGVFQHNMSNACAQITQLNDRAGIESLLNASEQ